MFKIIKYNQEYRDDMLFCYLSAKDALGVMPHLREDLLDIQKYYFDRNDMFWIAINDANRVIGMIGTDTVTEKNMWLKRLFIKPEMKRRGLASALLNVVEEYAKSKGILSIHTRFGDNYIEASQFYLSKGFIECERSDGLKHLIKSIRIDDLNIFRKQIDSIDEQIVNLLCERLNVVKNVAEYKKEHGLEILQKAREAEVLNKIASKINEQEYKEYILEIYAAVLETSKHLQGGIHGNNKT